MDKNLNGCQAKLVCLSANSILRPLFLFFLIYINNLSDNLESNIKLFSFGTSMFSVVSEPVTTTVTLNKDLDNVDLQGNQWKMPFNPDPSKQGQEVIFHVS